MYDKRCVFFLFKKKPEETLYKIYRKIDVDPDYDNRVMYPSVNIDWLVRPNVRKKQYTSNLFVATDKRSKQE